IVYLKTNGVLVLRLKNSLGLLGDEHPDLALLIDVDGLNEDDAIAVLAGPLRRIAPIGHVVGTAEDKRVPAKAGGEDVRLGFGKLLELGAKPEINLGEPLNRHVEGESIGRAFVVTSRHLERAVDRWLLARLSRGWRDPGCSIPTDDPPLRAGSREHIAS